MCAECGMNPCHPRCPNAPEPVPVHECVKCGYGILVGDKFWDSPEGKICEECVDERRRDIKVVWRKPHGSRKGGKVVWQNRMQWQHSRERS